MRFKESPEKTPGPADYNTLNYKSIQKEVLSRTTSSFNKTMTMQSRWNRSTFGHPHSNYDKVWFEENDKQFKNVEGPGPGYYELTDDRPRKKKSMFSFGKATRNMSGIDKKTKEQFLYNTAESDVYRRRTHQKYSIPRASRGFDVRKMNSLNSSLWKKGATFG